MTHKTSAGYPQDLVMTKMLPSATSKHLLTKIGSIAISGSAQCVMLVIFTKLKINHHST